MQHYFFGMVGMSLAAQMAVAPLVAFYFGRFSTYFLLTNFIVVPMATLILYGALLVLFMPVFGPALLWVVDILNKALEWLSQMPYASIDGLHPSVFQLCLIYIAVICFYWLVRIFAPSPNLHPSDRVFT